MTQEVFEAKERLEYAMKYGEKSKLFVALFTYIFDLEARILRLEAVIRRGNL